MDLAHGASFYPPASVRTVAIEEMVDADVVVIAAGRGGRPGESRLDLLRDNAAVVGEIGRRLAGARATLVVVSNPVDVLTQKLSTVSGLPAAGLRNHPAQGCDESRDRAGHCRSASVHPSRRSLPAVVGAQGAVEVLEPGISPSERERLHHSADVLHRAALSAGLS